MGISITDVIMTVRLGPVELAVREVVSDLYSICYCFFAGIFAANSPLIARATTKMSLQDEGSLKTG